MAEIVRMPKLSDTMTEGSWLSGIRKWVTRLRSGEVLAEIETDKATMEFESFQDGVLLHIGVDKGATAAVDSILAILGRPEKMWQVCLPQRQKDLQQLRAPAPTPAALLLCAPAPGSAPAPVRRGVRPVAAPVRSPAFFQWKGQGFAAWRPPGCRAQH